MLPKTWSNESFKSSNCEPICATLPIARPIVAKAATDAIAPALTLDSPPAIPPNAAPPAAPVVFILPSTFFNSD